MQLPGLRVPNAAEHSHTTDGTNRPGLLSPKFRKVRELAGSAAFDSNCSTKCGTAAQVILVPVEQTYSHYQQVLRKLARSGPFPCTILNPTHTTSFHHDLSRPITDYGDLGLVLHFRIDHDQSPLARCHQPWTQAKV